MKTSGLTGALVVALGLSFHLGAQPAPLRIDTDTGLVQIWISGEPGIDYRLEAAPAIPQAGEWDFLATFRAGDSAQSWLDASSLPRRFYRTVQLGPTPPEPALDFRLIDQLGRSRWLFYYLGMPSVRAVVLIFSGNSCAKVRELVPTIKA